MLNREPAHPALQPIQTLYNGYHFRSRLEARWAVFLDCLDLGWRYELEGYVVGGEPYLPDFYLPTLDVFLEIKPTAPRFDSREDRVARALAVASDKPVYLLYGPLVAAAGFGSDDDFAAATAYFPDGWDDDPYFWCECALCGWIGLEFEGRSARLACGCQVGDRAHNWASRRLLSAYAAAREMRFEHRR